VQGVASAKYISMFCFIMLLPAYTYFKLLPVTALVIGRRVAAGQ